MTPTPEAIVGLELDGRGFDEANRQLNTHAQGWERVEQLSGRVATHFDSMVGRIGSLAGAAGIGFLINDLTRLEDVAARAALSVNAIGGRAAYTPYQRALRGAAIATSQDSRELGAAITGIQSTVGGTDLNAPGAWRVMGTALGNFGRAYGLDVPTVGAIGGQLSMFGGQPVGAIPGLLNLMAGQARASGRSGQTGQWAQAMALITGQLAGMHGLPAGNLQGLGALYGGAGAANSMFYDPGMFGAGALGVDQGLAQAYGNPRLQAALQMAGIDYRMQREGLGGKRGPQMARRLLRYSDQMYGKGSIEQDVFLRSNFGDVSASWLESLGSGKFRMDQLQRMPGAPADQGAITRQRAHSDAQTLSGNLQKQRERAGGATDGVIQGVLRTIFGDNGPSVEEALGLMAGVGVGKRLLPRVFRGLKGMAARRAAGAAAADAAEGLGSAGGGAGDVLSHMNMLERRANVLSKALGIGGKALKVGGPAAAVAGFLMDPGNLWQGEDAWVWKQKVGELDHRFGPHWQTSRRAHAYADQAFGLNTFNKGSRLAQTFDKAFAPGTEPASDRFGKSVDRFDRAVQNLLGARGGLPTATASAAGAQGGIGGNAAGLADANSMQGSSMVLASMLTGQGGGKASLGALVGGNMAGIGGGGAGGGVTSGGPARWRRAANAAGARYGVHPGLLMGIADVETGGSFKSNQTSGAGAQGPMQFMPATWRQYGGGGSVWDVEDAMMGTARMLKANGAMGDVERAVFAYNHSDSYVQEVLRRAAKYGYVHKKKGGGGGHGGGGGFQSMSGGAPSAHDMAWLSGGGASGGGAGGGPGGGGGGAAGVKVDVHLDGRRVEDQRKLVRGRV